MFLDLKSLRILILDDSSHQRLLMKTFFSHYPQHEVIISGTSKEAIEIVENSKQQFDIALLDFFLKDEDVNGLDVANRVKEKDPRIQVIMITTEGDVKTQRLLLSSSNVHSVINKWTDTYAMEDLLNFFLSEKEKESRGRESLFNVV